MEIPWETVERAWEAVGKPWEAVGKPKAVVGACRETLARPWEAAASPWEALPGYQAGLARRRRDLCSAAAPDALSRAGAASARPAPC